MKEVLLLSMVLLCAACFAEHADSRISGKVRSSLRAHESVSSLDTEVAASGGIVTLRGVADYQAQLDLASDYAGAIEGVKSVVNLMSVRGDGTPGVRGADVAARTGNRAVTPSASLR